MQLTDTHIHLYAVEFLDDLNRLLKEAFDKNISRFVIPNFDSTTIDSMFSICERYEMACFPTLGLHPCSVKENYKTELDAIYQRLPEKRIYAIGEIGIDLYWDKRHLREQEDAFVCQLEWARETNLPVIIHSRESTNEIIRILKTNTHLRTGGIFHCFSGSMEQACILIDMGFYLGIGGVLTFKNAGLDKVVEQLELKNLVIETDAPYLAPVPHRGKRNEQAFLSLVAEKLSLLKQITLSEVAEKTTENANSVFKF